MCCEERRAALLGLAERDLLHFPKQQGSTWVDNSGGQRQQITLPMGGGNPTKGKKYDGKLDYVLTQKLCIGPPTGKLNNNKGVAVKSDQCRTKYTVKYL